MSNSDSDLKYAITEWVRLQKREQNLKFFKLVFMLVAGAIAFTFAMQKQGASFETDPYAALVRVDGVIAPGTPAGASHIGGALRQAFQDEKAKGVLIAINSPGGTPVQAMTIYEEILRLKAEHNKRVVVIAEDTMASGAYLLAMAADKIYAMPSSTIGSIGVVMEGLAYNGLADKWGLENRVYTSGDNKRRFDPFAEEKPEDVEKAKSILVDIHQQFIDIVRKGREGSLSGDPALLFSGDYWTGRQAIELGLIDEFGSLFPVLAEEFEVEKFKQFKVRTTFDDVVNLFSR